MQEKKDYYNRVRTWILLYFIQPASVSIHYITWKMQQVGLPESKVFSYIMLQALIVWLTADLNSLLI